MAIFSRNSAGCAAWDRVQHAEHSAAFALRESHRRCHNRCHVRVVPTAAQCSLATKKVMHHVRSQRDSARSHMTFRLQVSWRKMSWSACSTQRRRPLAAPRLVAPPTSAPRQWRVRCRGCWSALRATRSSTAPPGRVPTVQQGRASQRPARETPPGWCAHGMLLRRGLTVMDTSAGNSMMPSPDVAYPCIEKSAARCLAGAAL